MLVTGTFMFAGLVFLRMKIRMLFLAMGAMLAAMPAAACDLDLSHRSPAVADYVEAARPCLTVAPEGYEFDARMEREFLALINQERAAAGLPALKLRLELRNAARFHSLDMAYNDFFGHDGPDGRHPQDRVVAFDRRALFRFSAENVAMIASDNGRWDFEHKAVARLHRNLMNSPGHRANILSEEATYVALGVVQTKYGVWVTQVFMDLSADLPGDVPLRLRKGQSILEAPHIAGWNFKGYELQTDDGAYVSISKGVPAGLRGNAKLAAFARQPGDKPGYHYTIRLPGPAVTVGE